MKVLGLDIGSSSVGSAWLDTDLREVTAGVSAFPAGVEERSDKRGDPKNHQRRSSRSQRRSIRRRSDRKLELRRKLQQWGWMPGETSDIRAWMDLNPWSLRRDGLCRPLAPEEFGRILLHMSQRRGPSWIDEEDEEASDRGAATEDDEAKERPRSKKKPLRAANETLAKELENKKTFGQFMADLFDKRRPLGEPIRNRSDQEGNPNFQFFPDRQMLRKEFEVLWGKQRGFTGPLAEQLTEDRKRELFNPRGTNVWKCQGLLWGQRNTYWDAGTLGRCDLEPTDRVCPKADMYAQEFLVLQDVNNIRLAWMGESARPLDPAQRRKVLDRLESVKSADAKTIRTALKFGGKENRDLVTLNIDHDAGKKLNTNWFVREIIGGIGRDAWDAMSAKTQESVNRAVCAYDPREPADVENLAAGARKWWGLTEEQAGGFMAGWRARPGAESRISLSRRAVRNLLPYMRQGETVTEARRHFAEDSGNGASDEQRRRYKLGGYQANHAVRHFLSKHPDQLPPAPVMANPVVRKAIHHVRRHVAAYMRRFGCKPDRVIVELARDARLSAKVADEITADNRRRRDERRAIQENPDFAAHFQGMSKNQVERAVERVLLCRAQEHLCAYSHLDGNEGRIISEPQAIKGDGLEVDHLIPRSRGGSNGRGNKILCYSATNRGKGNQTPKEWLSKEQFEQMILRFGHWKEGSKEDRLRWNNLHKDVFDMEAYLKSQLTDTAYAARQVMQWLEQVLYGGEPDGGVGGRRVFATNGRYTSVLRRNWGIFFDEGNPDATQKSRADHRHHAIDAVVVACCGPERIQQVASVWQEQELLWGEGKQPPRFAIAPPWETFRNDVLETIGKLVVSHRPERRKVVGGFHMKTLYGPILDQSGKLTTEFTQRISVAELSPQHLRVPAHWETLREKLQDAQTKAEKRELRREMLNLQDVTPGKSGVVRDLWCREELRQCLMAGGVDPDAFAKGKIMALIRLGKLRLADGQPLKKVTLRKVFNNTVQVSRRVPDMRTHQRVIDPDPQSTRVYEAQSNHHVEIRQNKKGKWVGQIVTTFEAAGRLRPPQASGLAKRPAVDRADNADGKFVMSLAVGETVYMAHPETGRPGYFVVFKLDSGSSPVIHFKAHWDAGKFREDENCPARVDIGLSPSQLQTAVVDGVPPRKVWIGPLGEEKVYRRD